MSNDAYDKVDRYLRNNLDDADYAEFSIALESVFSAQPVRPPLTAAQAVADELLEALIALDNYVCNNLSSDYPTGVDVNHKLFEAARAAIAKATGGAS